MTSINEFFYPTIDKLIFLNLSYLFRFKYHSLFKPILIFEFQVNFQLINYFLISHNHFIYFSSFTINQLFLSNILLVIHLIP